MNDPQHGSEAAVLGAPPPWGRAEATPQNLQSRVLFGAFLVLAVATGTFAVGLALGVRGTDVTMLGLAAATFALGCAPLVIDQGRLPERRHVLLSFVSLIFMMHFVVPALMLYLPATGPVDASSTAFTNLMPEHVVDGQWMALLGLVSLQVGYALPTGRLIGRTLRPARADWPLLTCLSIAVAFLVLGWAVSLAGLVGILPATLGTGAIGVIATGRNYANVLLAYAYLRYGSHMAALLIAANVALLLLLGLITSDKQDALIGPALVVLTSMLLTKRIRARWIALGLLAVMAIYPASEFVRQGLLPNATVSELLLNPGHTLGAISAHVSSGDVVEHLDTGFQATAHRVDGLGIASVIIRDTPSVSPFQYGRTLGLFFVAFVPRALWSGKPDIHIGQWITAVYGSGPHIDARTAPTPIGEFYLNFGIIGIVFGLMLLGIVFRLAHETLSRHGATAPSLLAQVVIVLVLGLNFAGSVAGVYSQVAFTLIPLWLLHLGIRMFTPTVPVGRVPDAAHANASGSR